MKLLEKLPEYWRLELTPENLHIVNEIRNTFNSHPYNKPIDFSRYKYLINHDKDGYIGTNSNIEAEMVTIQDLEYHLLKRLPEKWAIKCTEDNFEKLTSFYNKKVNSKTCYNSKEYINNYFHSLNFGNKASIFSDKPGANFADLVIKERFIEITYEQLENYLNMNNKKLYSIKTIEKRTDLLIYIDSEEEYEKIKQFTNSLCTYFGKYYYSLSGRTFCSISSKTNPGSYSSSCKILTLNDILELQTNKINTMQKFTVSVTDVLKIHSIACSEWKTKIVNYLSRTDTNQQITFTQSEVKEMFKAATFSQKPVLEKIFGSFVKPIEWDKIKTGSKVMIKHTEEHCGGGEKIDYTKFVEVIFFKTPYRINSDKNFIKQGRYNSYCTFYQNGNYIFFSSQNNTDYITEVIEY